MVEPIRARLTAREGRRFAFPVGTALLVLAALSTWRGHLWAPRILAGLGAILFAAGAVVPHRLGPLYRGWMAFAGMLSKVTTPIFLGVIYFLVLTPIGLLLRLFARNPMRHTEKNGSFWSPPQSGGRSDLTAQF